MSFGVINNKCLFFRKKARSQVNIAWLLLYWKYCFCYFYRFKVASFCLFQSMILQNVPYPKELKPLENYFTVVIFSSPLDHVPQYHKLLVENINRQSSTLKSNENESKIVETICKIYSSKLSSNKSTKYLRIVCINASKGDLSGEKTKDILKYLKSSVNKSVKKSPIDVIILPKFSLQSSENALDIMESLWYLREHTVLISSSSLHATLPSTEAIAVRGDKVIPKTQDSVQDFVVTFGSNDAPTHTKKQVLEKCDKEQPGKSDKEQPRKSDKEQPGKSDKELPGKSDKEQPGKSDKEQPGKSDKELPGKSDKEQPGKSDKELPGKSDKEQPGKSDKELPGKSDKEQPGKSDKEQAGKSDKEQPGKSDKEQSGKSDKEQSGKSDKEQSGKSDKLNIETEESVKELAPAVVCGIALNILDCLQRSNFKTSGNHFKRRSSEFLLYY